MGESWRCGVERPREGAVIARLRGTVAARSPAGLLIDVGGVGYLVAATPRVNARVGEEATIQIHTHVREDALQLYGFASTDERDLFELLLGVSGIGPKVALAIVSGSPPAELRRAIARDDLARFEAIPGIGRKTAQRVVLELKDRLGSPEPTVPAGEGLEARDALVALGWNVIDADRALDGIDGSLSTEEQVRQVLRRAA
jgi:Holliday junction DNA helicase RuvA